jgi:uncharacterized protein
MHSGRSILRVATGHYRPKPAIRGGLPIIIITNEQRGCMKRIISVVLGLLSLSLTAKAASFDCDKAATTVEKLICSDSSLSKFDDGLSTLYKYVLLDKSQSRTIKQDEKQWVKERNACTDVSCIRGKYLTRLMQLNLVAKGMKAETARTPLKTASDIEACKTVADYANRNELQKLYVSASNESESKIESQFGRQYGDTSYWLVDLNDDGVPVPFIINVDGTANASNGHAISGKVKVDIENADDNDIDLNLVTVGGKYYVLSHNSGILSQLWRLTHEKFQPICNFIKRDKQLIKITKGNSNPVCTAELEGRIKHIDFKPITNKIDYEGGEITGLATADVNNDGKPEKIALVHYESGAGRGSSAYMVRAIDKKNSAHAKVINDILASSIDGFNVNQGVFTYGGLTYFDEFPEVILIRNGKMETVCNAIVSAQFDFK